MFRSAQGGKRKEGWADRHLRHTAINHAPRQFVRGRRIAHLDDEGVAYEAKNAADGTKARAWENNNAE